MCNRNEVIFARASAEVLRKNAAASDLCSHELLDIALEAVLEIIDKYEELLKRRNEWEELKNE